SVIERGDVAADLARVLDRHARLLIQLEQHQVGERRLRALDHRGQHRLLAHEAVEQQRSVRQQAGHTVELPQRMQRLIELAAQCGSPVDPRPRRQRRGDEGAYAFAGRRNLEVLPLECALHGGVQDPKTTTAANLAYLDYLKQAPTCSRWCVTASRTADRASPDRCRAYPS